MSLSTTFERDALLWSVSDYDRIMAIAHRCDGAHLSNGSVVDATAWQSDVGYARTVVLPIAMMSRQIMDRTVVDPASFVTLPECRIIGGYRVDVSSGIDNARTLIGRDLAAVPVSDMPRLERHLMACQQILQEMMTTAASEGVDLRSSYEAARNMADRYRFVRQAMSVWDLSRRSDDLLVTRDGMAIPPTLASEEVRRIVGYYDRWKGRLNDDETVLGKLLTMIEVARKRKLSDIDGFYVDAVSSKLNERIFGR